jgi:hypothetical protein
LTAKTVALTRIGTGRGALSSRISPITSVVERVPRLRPAPFSPSLYGEKVPAGR